MITLSAYTTPVKSSHTRPLERHAPCPYNDVTLHSTRPSKALHPNDDAPRLFQSRDAPEAPPVATNGCAGRVTINPQPREQQRALPLCIVREAPP